MVDVNEENIVILDNSKRFIPLTYDKLFKGLFKNDLELLKIFIIEQLGVLEQYGFKLNINNIDECEIELIDTEISKFNKNEYQKTVDIYVRLLDIYVNIEINREYFNVVKIRNLIYSDRLYSMLLKQGNSLDDLDKIKFVQINLNVLDKNDISGKKLAYGTELLVTYGLKSKKIYNSNKLVLIRYLEYYWDLYYNKSEKLSKADLWMVLLASKNFQELYEVSLKLFDKDKHYQFIRSVILMINDRRFFEDWEMEILNNPSDKERIKIAKLEGFDEGKEEGREEGREEGLEEGREVGLEEGIKKGITETIRSMVKVGIDLNLIAEATGKSKKDIKKMIDVVNE